MAQNQFTIENPKLSDYVIVAVPTVSGLAKYFIGQVCEVQNEELKINFLKKTKSKFEHDKYHFTDINDTSIVTKTEIMKVLEKPVQHRRGQLEFKDAKNFSFKIC